ncbi:hypothetical protein BURPS1106B_A0419 [Burkholderia pseudomallei 1106b]|uniref:Uncharacterized protein n=1 Tax=Burkholderia pseudomallei 1710a TaxID=320371 RepID=A0A0E1W8J1_BURPE|nr:hypothetical protein BURPS1655_K0168 [Burkholderia pseudomallei 1655]EES23864.1 hypothetical protein BURPS1106B_A0419 [Burkholderia pseudomallei 1106b]EET08641.1 hypothetical protein BURPS1710A_1481 [Burkholderia pseudomallei 1710a]
MPVAAITVFSTAMRRGGAARVANRFRFPSHFVRWLPIH